jgi:hypothetical protein
LRNAEGQLGLVVDKNHSRGIGGDKTAIGIREYVCHDGFLLFDNMSR